MSRNNSINTEQYLVIKNLNNYLKYHNLPLNVSEDGICHALSTLYIQYVLDGKEQEFEKLLSYIAQEIPVKSNELDAELCILVEKIVALQEGKSTRNKYSQSNSHEQLQVKGHNLESVFQIGLETHLDNWIEILKEINLRGNQVMRVSTLEHTIAIARDKDGTYKVYDPNNSKMNQIFANEEEMVKWLAKEAFNFSLFSSGSDTLDMNISVISDDPSLISKVFPSKVEILQKYLTPEQEKIDPKRGGGLNFAMKFDDAESVEYILNKRESELTDQEISRIASCAIDRDSGKALGKLIDKLPKNSEEKWLEGFFLHALSSGSYRCAQELLKTPYMKTHYNNLISSYEYTEILNKAFKGMNEQIIDEVLDNVLQKQGLEAFTPQLLSGLIEISIKEQNSHAINLLAKKIANLDQIIPSNRLDFLKKAIENNDPLMVRALITNLKISAQELNCLNMGLSIINKYNVEIFTTLKEAGYEFSPQATELIESKKTQSIGILKSLGIALIRFSEFLTNQNKIQVDSDKIKQFSPQETDVNDKKNVTPDNPEPKKHAIIFATDDESEDEELQSNARSLKQNIQVFKAFKDKFKSIISSAETMETATETNEASYNTSPRP